jgi:hypothetical protein
MANLQPKDNVRFRSETHRCCTTETVGQSPRCKNGEEESAQSQTDAFTFRPASDRRRPEEAMGKVQSRQKSRIAS